VKCAQKLFGKSLRAVSSYYHPQMMLLTFQWFLFLYIS
jgi:hypothetical protein